MKFLHIADLHLGKRLYEVSLIEDQEYILDQIVQIAAEQQCDWIAIAGDIYDKSSPSAESMALFDKFLNRCMADNIKVVAISGNHDSDKRVGYLSAVAKASGICLSTPFNKTLQRIDMRDKWGQYSVYLMPFLRLWQIRQFYPDKDFDNLAQAIRYIINCSNVDFSGRNILLAHQFIAGGVTCDSEDIQVGGLDNLPPQLFAGFDYVALGHLHQGQSCGNKTIRYSGSPLKYSFSEVGHKKSVTLVNIEEKGQITIQQLPLAPLRNMREIQGSFNSVVLNPQCLDYVHVQLSDNQLPPDGVAMLRRVYPNLLKVSVAEDVFWGEGLSHVDVQNKTPLELFAMFYKDQTGCLLNNSEVQYLQQLIVRAREEQI